MSRLRDTNPVSTTKRVFQIVITSSILFMSLSKSSVQFPFLRDNGTVSKIARKCKPWAAATPRSSGLPDHLEMLLDRFHQRRGTAIDIRLTFFTEPLRLKQLMRNINRRKDGELRHGRRLHALR